MTEFRGTTIVAVKRPNGDICIGGDGQVTMGTGRDHETNSKEGKKDLQKLGYYGFCRFGGGCVYPLLKNSKKKLEEHSGNLKRAAVALAQTWRSDRGDEKSRCAFTCCRQRMPASDFRQRRGYRARMKILWRSARAEITPMRRRMLFINIQI